MLGAIGAALASEALRRFFAALFENVFGWLDRRAEALRRERLAQLELLARLEKERADAERRAAEVSVRDRDGTADDLDRGVF